MDEQKLIDLISITMMGCDEIIDKAAEMLNTDKQKIDFVMSCVINLMGNRVLTHSVPDTKTRLQNAQHSIEELAKWFHRTINKMEYEPRSIQ